MVDPIKYVKVLMLNYLPSQNITMIEIEPNALHYVMVPGLYRSRRWLEHLQNSSVTDWKIYLWWKGLLGADILQYVDYIAEQ